MVPDHPRRGLEEVPSISESASHASTEGPEEGLVSVGHTSHTSWTAGEVVPPRMGAHLELAITRLIIRTSLSAPFSNAPQESSVNAVGDLAEVSSPEIHANIGIYTSPPDLEVGAHANIGAITSLATRQTTRTALGLGVGQCTAPIVSGFSLTPQPSHMGPTLIVDH